MIHTSYLTWATLPKCISWLALLTLANTLLCCLANGYTLKIPPTPQRIGEKLFYLSSYLAQAFLFAVVISGIVFLFSCITKNSTTLIAIGTFFNFVLIMLSFANSIVLGKYRFSLNADIFRLVFGKGGSEVVQVHPLEYVIFGAAFSIVLAIVFCVQYVSLHAASHYLNLTLLSYLVGVLAIHYILNQIAYIFLSINDSMPILQYTIKIYLYHDLSLCRLLKYCNVIQDDLYKALNHKSKLNYPLKTLTHTNKKPLNIMLIVIDSLRFDAITSQVMPNTYKFSQTASRFDSHFSGGNTTQPGIFSIFYGIPATYWKATIKYNIPPAMLTTMTQQQYQMGIFASATLENPPFHKNIFSSLEQLQTFTNGNTPLERDTTITKSMIQFIQQRDTQRPFFGFMFYDSPHGYYAIPELPKHFQPTKTMNHITINNKSDPLPIKNLYLSAVHETDKLINKVLDTLKKEQLLESTIVMITSDHGQEFNDLQKNYWEHPNNFARFQTKVPLIVHHPHHSPQRHEHYSTHYDIVPTLMQDALGVTNPVDDYSIGNHLFTTRSTPITIMGNYTNYAILTKKYIAEIQKSGCYQIMDHNMNYHSNPTIDPQIKQSLIEQVLRYTTLKNSREQYKCTT